MKFTKRDKNKLEVTLDNHYKLEFTRNMFGGISIAGWARNKGIGVWQWFNGKFPFEEKYENTNAWKNAWEIAYKNI
jgi:hypothetical protein